ncbi:TrkA family potassium uptake protein [Syntrophotalea acetylenica]|jgi:trk system potassium uptake protein TrkA|uniref:potassium channel family protein n=1 Tax=Syntrophotalea acetylenica TaxID=29542 RepID=UPI002A359EB2|nr:TrkA family potassium uptake protein [Syntrophotalea acetylenica]MDY0261065.1 TrkA family potassium uptake protein [Syntrophotalea acetylenica]
MRVIVAGAGKLLYYLARQFASKGYQITLVVSDAAEAQALCRRVKALVLHGDGSDPHVLEEAGARTADVVLALASKDQDNLAICQIAHKMFHVPRTVALVNDPQNEDVFHKLGVSVAFSATQIIARILEERAGFEDIASLMPLAGGRVTISEIALREDAPAADKTLRDLALPQGALVGGILRDGHVIVPRGDTSLRGGDRLIIISGPDCYDRVLRLITGEET